MSYALSRRRFLGGLAAVGALTPEAPLLAQSSGGAVRQPRPRLGLDEYDAAAKLAYSENPFVGRKTPA